MKFKVLSRQAFGEFKSTEPYIAIYISDPHSEDVLIGDTKNIRFLLTLKFHDIDSALVNKEECTRCNGTGILPEFEHVNNGVCYKCTDLIGIKCMDNKDAKNIVDFVETFKNEVDLIVVHCEAGISRSSATAGALSLVLNGSDKEFFEGTYYPNMFVYRKILNMYHLQLRYKNEK